MDLVADFSSSMASRINELAQPCTNGMPSSTFGDLIGAQGTIDQTSPVCTLGPAFEFEEDPYASDCDSVYEDNLSTAATFGGRCSRDDPIVQRKRKARRNHNVDKYLSSHETAPTSSYSSPPSIFVDRTPKRSSAERLKGRQGDRKGRQNRLGDHKNKRNQCQHCPIEWNEHTKQWKSKFSFERQEHLSRHVKSLHNPTPFFCKVVGCHAHKDYKGEKVKPRPGIQSRHDNLLPHYRTHFKYGINEKSGKNKRLSMKESLAIGLRNEDERWDWFLAGRMSIDHPDGPRDFHNSWKMMGYSILETQNTRIKTLFPEWEGPAEETLERHDARWKALRGGKMTYELAMSRGLDMPETEAQGLLGVTMMETEQMGIKNLDGRWTMLLSCCMTMEDAKKLGVEDLNRATIAAQGKRRR